MIEQDHHLTPAPQPTAFELECLKETREFAQFVQTSQQHGQLQNEELLALQKKLQEIEKSNEALKMENYELQGEASNLRRRMEAQAAQKQQEVCQK